MCWEPRIYQPPSSQPRRLKYCKGETIVELAVREGLMYAQPIFSGTLCSPINLSLSHRARDADVKEGEGHMAGFPVSLGTVIKEVPCIRDNTSHMDD